MSNETEKIFLKSIKWKGSIDIRKVEPLWNSVIIEKHIVKETESWILLSNPKDAEKWQVVTWEIIRVWKDVDQSLVWKIIYYKRFAWDAISETFAILNFLDILATVD